MAKIVRTATINASVRTVYGYIKNPANWLEFWPSIVEITDIISLPNGGYSGLFEYKMVGLLFRGEGKYTSVVSNKLLTI